jgi:hypothetical protein
MILAKPEILNQLMKGRIKIEPISTLINSSILNNYVKHHDLGVQLERCSRLQPAMTSFT